MNRRTKRSRSDLDTRTYLDYRNIKGGKDGGPLTNLGNKIHARKWERQHSF